MEAFEILSLSRLISDAFVCDWIELIESFWDEVARHKKYWHILIVLGCPFAPQAQFIAVPGPIKAVQNAIFWGDDIIDL